MKVLTVILAICMLSIIGCSSDEEKYNEGMDAYWDEGYETALALLTPFAEDGDAGAQYYLGNMYSDGKGVPENDKTAVEWYTLAAEQGHVYAQLYLGWSFPRSSKFGYM